MPAIPGEFFEKALQLIDKVVEERARLLQLQAGEEGEEVDVDIQKDLINEHAQILALSGVNLVQTANRFSSSFAEEDHQPLGLMYLCYTASLVSSTCVKFVQSYRSSMENALDYLAREQQEEHQRELQENVIHFKAACIILKQGADCNATQKFRDALAKAEEIVVLTDLLMDSALSVDSSQLLRFNRSFSAEIHVFIDLINAVTSGATKDAAAVDARALMTEELLPQLLQSIIVSAKNISGAKRGAFGFNHAAQVRSRTLVEVFDLTLQLQKLVFGYDLNDPSGPQLKFAYRPPRPTRTETPEGVVRSKAFEELKSTSRRRSAVEEDRTMDGIDALKEFADRQKKARSMRRSSSEKTVTSDQNADEEDSAAKGKKTRSSGKAETLKRKSKKTGLSRTSDLKQLFSKKKRAPAPEQSQSPPGPQQQQQKQQQQQQKGGTEQRLHLDSSSPTVERKKRASNNTLDVLSIDSDSEDGTRGTGEEPGNLEGAKTMISSLSLSLNETAGPTKALRDTGSPRVSSLVSPRGITGVSPRGMSPRSVSLASTARSPRMSPTATAAASPEPTVPEMKLTSPSGAETQMTPTRQKSPRKQAEEVAMQELQVYAQAALQVMKRLKCFSDGWAEDEENVQRLQKELVKSFKLSSRRDTLVNVRKHQSTSRMMRLAVSNSNIDRQPEPAFQVTSSWRKINSSSANLLKDVDLPTLKAETGPLLEKTKTFVSQCLQHVELPEEEEEAPVALGNAAAEVFSLLLKITSICGKQEAADFLQVPVSQLLSSSRTVPHRDEEYIRSVSSEEQHVIHLLCKTYLESLRKRAQSLCSLIAQLVSAVTSIPEGSSAMPQSLFMQVMAVTWSLKEEVEAILDHSETARYLHSRYVGQEGEDTDDSSAVAWARVKGRSVGSRGNLHVIAASRSNIWEIQADEQEVLPDEADCDDEAELNAGSINQLIRHLCSPSATDEYIGTFFKTCPTFASLVLVVQKLRQLYNVPEEHQEQRPEVVQGIVRATKALISLCQLDLTSKLERELRALFDLIGGDDNETVATLVTLLEEALAARAKMLAVPGPNLDTHLEGDVAHFPPPAEVFVKTPVDVLASHITAVDFHLFQSIQAREFFDLAWSKAHLRHRAPNIMAMITRVNRISYWVPNVILWHSSMSDRGKVVEKFIALADELRKLRNYSALMGVLGGLGMSSTARLKFTFLAVNEQKLALLKELQSLMSSNKSFGVYRAQLASCQPPAVPYLGVYLSDLTFINDGNQDLVGEACAINFKKRRMVHRVLDAVETYQKGAYETPVHECAQLFTLSFPQLNDDDLYKLSLKREPRGAEITDILAL